MVLVPYLSTMIYAALALGPSDMTVDLGITTRAPTYQGSGLLYGINADASQPASHYTTDIHLKFFRGGGGHAAPEWQVGGAGADFDTVWNVAKSMVNRAHGENAKAVLVVSDMWGDNSSLPFPGDNSSWTGYDAFMDNVISKVQALGPAADTVLWELWNEPARGFFWKRDFRQFLDTWTHGFKRLKAAMPNAQVVGPSIWGGATPGMNDVRKLWPYDNYNYDKATTPPGQPRPPTRTGT
jgi:hypothetical protein